MRETLEHPEGRVQVDRREDGRATLTVELADPSTFMLDDRLDTAYPTPLIALILEHKGPAWLCDEIRREEDPGYLLGTFEWALFSYVDEKDLAGKRLLDFGCGSGASTIALGRRYPKLELVGVELEQQHVDIARTRADFYGLSNVIFQLSPGGTGLPSQLGSFDIALMSGVFEHLLPAERKAVMPLVWSHIKRGGILFVNQTPNRWFPLEGHTTGLPLVNYLPDGVTHWMARRFSRRVDLDESWETLLRRGIRGATVREIVRSIGRGGGTPELLGPSLRELYDRIDLWLAISSGKQPSRLKRWMARGMKALKAASGAELVPELSLAIRKST